MSVRKYFISNEHNGHIENNYFDEYNDYNSYDDCNGYDGYFEYNDYNVYDYNEPSTVQDTPKLPISVVSSALYNKTENSKMKVEINKLKIEINKLKEENNRLREESNRLKEENKILKEENNANKENILIKENNKLRKDNILLQIENESIKTKKDYKPSDGDELIREHIKLKKKFNKLDQKNNCKICLSKEINTLFKACNHLISCEECAKKLDSCPICRKKTISVKVYRS